MLSPVHVWNSFSENNHQPSWRIVLARFNHWAEQELFVLASTFSTGTVFARRTSRHPHGVRARPTIIAREILLATVSRQSWIDSANGWIRSTQISVLEQGKTRSRHRWSDCRPWSGTGKVGHLTPCLRRKLFCFFRRSIKTTFCSLY